MENKTVLVIEGNELNMKLVRSILQLGHYQILEAEDAETGIQLARENLPNLILMDIQLPGMDGLEATRIVRKDPILRHIPVVAHTSHAMQGDEQKATATGCTGYIAKPIDTRSFLDNLAGYLEPQGVKPLSKSPRQPDGMSGLLS